VNYIAVEDAILLKNATKTALQAHSTRRLNVL